MLTTRPSKRSRNVGPDKLHETGRAPRGPARTPRPCRPARGPSLARGELRRPCARTSAPRPSRHGPAPRCRPGRRRRRPPRAVRRVGAGVEQRLEVGARAGHEHDDASGTTGRARPECIDREVRAPARSQARSAGSSALPPGGQQAAEQAAAAERDDRVHQHLPRSRPDLGHPARPDGAAGDCCEQPDQCRGEHTRDEAAQRAPGPTPWSGACAGCGPRPARPAARGAANRSGVHAGVEPLSGSAASSGNIGTGPTATTVGETRVPVPTAKPGPRR